MPLTCIIIEDEPLAMERMQQYVASCELLQLQASFDNAGDALAYLAKNAPQLAFSDIHLGNDSGIDMIEKLQVSTRFILTTAYASYALKSYDLDVIDYLLKPFTYDRFLQAVQKAASQVQSNSHPPASIFVKTGTRTEKIMLDDICYIEGNGDYRSIMTTTKKILTLITFSEWERQLPPQQFIRIHKSFIINLQHVVSINKDLITITGKEIPISETYKKAFYRQINPTEI